MGIQSRILGIAAALATGAVLFAAPAQARTSVNVSIGTGVPYGYAQPGYIYNEPSYVYSQPSYVYTQPSYVYTQPGYVYTQPSYIYYDNGGGHRRHHSHRGAWRDRDGDGVPNRFDRRPNNPYRY